MSGDWRARARCAEVDPELFFPDKGGSVAAAKRICLSCEVRRACLAWALAQPAPGPDGIWGGTSANERRMMRRALEVAA